MTTPEIDWTRHGRKYSDFNPRGVLVPTHPVLPIAGTGKASWDAQLERWVV
jgi:hypothetical protein